jgi:hypothetical protein
VASLYEAIIKTIVTRIPKSFTEMPYDVVGEKSTKLKMNEMKNVANAAMKAARAKVYDFERYPPLKTSYSR